MSISGDGQAAGNGGRQPEILDRGREAIRKAKQGAFEYAFAEGLNLLAKTDDKNYLRIVSLMERKADSPQQRFTVQWLRSYLSPGAPGAAYLNRVVPSLNPNVRRRYLAGFVANLLFRGTENIAQQEQILAEMGGAPKLVVISPTDACNYRCEGCYADAYGRYNQLEPELVQRIIDECREMGVLYYVISGGEPFVYKPLLEIFERNRDCVFQVYTNGSKIDKEMAHKLAELGNVCPCVSVEGFEAETDGRRGEGAWKTAVQAWENLREAGCIYGFSATATTKNYLKVTSEEFINEMIKYNVHYGWYFIYIPTGGHPDLSLFLSPEQRNELRGRIHNIRRTMPMLVGDFWNDGCLTDGCLAGGRHYFHINSKGDVEPCVFSHFTVENIRNTHIKDILGQPFFRELRDRTELETRHNRLAPCSIIDHPHILRETVLKHGARPSHEGADALWTKIGAELAEYGRRYDEISKPIFDKEYRPWYEVMQDKKVPAQAITAQQTEPVEEEVPIR